MERRKLGKSGIEVSPIAFGAWAIGGWQWGGAEHNDSINAIHACLDHGITTIDTAPIYGFGYSEKIVGEAIRGRRDRYEILTKYGMRWDTNAGEFYFMTIDNEGVEKKIQKYSGRESIIKECENSLRRIGTDYIDLYQIHWPDLTTPIQESMEAVQKLIDQGKIRAAGVSNYSLDQMKEASKVISLCSNQVPYSMVRREIEEDIVPWCIENECAILAYSPLQRGLLSGKITPDYPFKPGDSRPDTPYFKNENIVKTNTFLDKIRPVAERQSKSLSQLVLKWTLMQPGITVALSGGRNPEQVKENAGSIHVEITDEEMNLINKELSQVAIKI